MALIDLKEYSRLVAILNNSKLATTNNPVYQILKVLIEQAILFAKFTGQISEEELAQNKLIAAIEKETGPTGASGTNGAFSEDVIQILIYFNKRLKFIEDCLDIQYKQDELTIPDEITFLGEQDGL